jgi:hypothetical protein
MVAVPIPPLFRRPQQAHVGCAHTVRGGGRLAAVRVAQRLSADLVERCDSAAESPWSSPTEIRVSMMSYKFLSWTGARSTP